MTAEISFFTPATPTYFTPIECAECGSKAHLMRRTPVRKGEERTFECEACKRQTVFTVSD